MKCFSGKYSYSLLCALLLAGALQAQPPSNKPNGTSQVPALPAGKTAFLPTGYPAGTKVNYVRTWEAMGTYNSESAFDAATQANDGYKHIKEITQYIDGLGRPIQTVSRQITPGNSPQDIVLPIVYDELGRETHKFMSSVYRTKKFFARPIPRRTNFLRQKHF
jgi:hypothetical protein